jgi:hypothetical protein
MAGARRTVYMHTVSQLKSTARGRLISLWLCKENNKLRDEKNVFTYSLQSSTHLWLCCCNFFNPSKKISFSCTANRKSQWLNSTPTYIRLRLKGLKTCVLRDKTPHGPVTYCLHFKGRRISQARNNSEAESEKTERATVLCRATGKLRERILVHILVTFDLHRYLMMSQPQKIL